MNNDKIVLVTGAAGFLGSYLIRLLIDKGYRVRGIRRNDKPANIPTEIDSQIEWFETDITDVVGMEKAFLGAKIVCHCAGLPSFHPKDAMRMHQTNVEGTANVVNLCLEHKIEKLIHVSSIAALGRSPERLTLDENCEWVQSKDNSAYAQTKHLAELEVYRGIAEGLNAVIISPSVIVGSKSWDDGMAGFFKKIDQGLKFCPSGQSGFVDVRDVAIFMETMIHADYAGERFILNAVNIKHQAFFGMIARALQVSPPPILIGPFLAEVAWRVEWVKEMLLGIPPVATKESARASVTHYYYRNDKSLQVPGFSYRPFEKTIQEMAEDYLYAKSHGFEPMRMVI